MDVVHVDPGCREDLRVLLHLYQDRQGPALSVWLLLVTNHR